ncbi:MAG: nucleotidyltransferase domain-containing protein [Candidatus Helarchaeota archaeon]|nr:nucleotidyltransferase domain-containing protein [Candidatus Helarchaeota archaeon]
MFKLKMIEIAEFLAKRATSRFPDKIAIIVVYGSVALGTEHEYSDIDMYAIVDNEADTDLPWNFIFQKQTVEFWKMDWNVAEQIALGNKDTNPWAVSASLFNNNKILYARSESDRARFNSLSKKIKRSERDNIEQIMNIFNKGYSTIERIWIAKKNDDLTSARWAVWNLINYTVACLSLINNTFFMKNWGKNLQEVFKLPILPENYSNNVETLSKSSNFDEMMSIMRKLISDIRRLILEKQKKINISVINRKNTFWNNYIGIKSYINKVRSACQEKDILTASYAATELQIVIAEQIAIFEKKIAIDAYNFNSFKEIKSYYNQLKFPDLMIGISKGDFQQIEQAINIIDSRLEQYYRIQDIDFIAFKDWNELETHFNQY